MGRGRRGRMSEMKFGWIGLIKEVLNWVFVGDRERDRKRLFGRFTLNCWEIFKLNDSWKVVTSVG